MLISVRVHPGAKRNEVTGLVGEVWHVKIAAPPVRGKANEGLIELLAGVLGLPKSRITVVRGHTGRSKVVAVAGLSEEKVRERLASSSAASR